MQKREKEPFLDRVLLHSKNADERLFDMVLRFITFVILIIIIWIYADLVHAKADGVGGVTIGELYHIDFEKLPVSTTQSLLWRSDEYSLVFNEYMNFGFNSNYHPIYISTGYTTNHIVPSELYIDNCYMFYCYAGAGLNGWYVYAVPKDVIDTGKAIWTWQGFYATEDFNYYAGSIWNDNTIYPFSTFTFNHSSMNQLSVDQYCTTANCYFSNCPYWGGTRLDTNVLGGPVDYNSVIEDAIDPDFVQDGSLYNCNYFLYGDIMTQPWDYVEPTENDSNHLYLKDFNVCLTPASSFIDSSVVITMSWDEWIEKYIDNYYVDIYYSLDYNGEPWSRNDTDPPVNNPMNYTVVYENIPLTKFRSYYQEDISTILGSMYINHESALAMMNALNAARAFTYTSNGNLTFQDVLNGSSAEFSTNKGGGGSVNLGVLYSYLYQNLSPLHAGETTVFIDQFDFTVEFDIYSKTVQEESMLGGRTFDLLNGTSNTNYNILNNQNPWNGSTTEGKSEKTGGTYYGDNTNIAYGGSASAQGGNANVGNITITTGNGYKDTELHQLTDQDIVHNHQKIITVIEDLKYCFHQFAQESNHNSFIQMIYDDYEYIPGIEYITSSIIIICGVCILIFIIKIAF